MPCICSSSLSNKEIFWFHSSIFRVEFYAFLFGIICPFEKYRASLVPSDELCLCQREACDTLPSGMQFATWPSPRNRVTPHPSRVIDAKPVWPLIGCCPSFVADVGVEITLTAKHLLLPAWH